MPDDVKAARAKRGRRASRRSILGDMLTPRFVVSLLCERRGEAIVWRTSVSVRGSPWTALGSDTFSSEAEALAAFVDFYLSDAPVAGELRESVAKSVRDDEPMF